VDDGGSVIICVRDIRTGSAPVDNIYLFNKKIFLNLLREPKAQCFPCQHASNLIPPENVIDRPLYTMKSIISRSILVDKPDLDSLMTPDTQDVFLILTKTTPPETFASIVGLDVLNGGSWVSGLHCNAGAEKEVLWNVNVATNNLLGLGGSSAQSKKLKTKKKQSKKLKTKKIKTTKKKQSKKRKTSKKKQSKKRKTSRK
jgi:hypothetical protein